MTEMVHIDVVIDEHYEDPLVAIHTKSRSEQVENIIHAVENAANESFPPIYVYSEERIEPVLQREIFRIRTEGRKIFLDTQDASYLVRETLARLEEELDTQRFFRISQSEIINLYKVKCFDISVYGTIGVEFDNGLRTWASRRYVKALKEKLNKVG
ncbi:MAG: LytTR family transcriptional regulator [Lachnospiraceae bacterium]|jgi:DNA-binding LytR/AlgR family response regulator|nr:LytTR family transcriptional regulator [Lachnospiraceae bacterium]